MSPDGESTLPGQLLSDARGETSMHVRRILEEPSDESWLWLVERLTPMLEAQVEYRLPGRLRHLCDPQDLINEAWIVTFLRLHTLRARNGRWTPVLLRFLSTTLLNKINELLRREAHRRVLDAGGDPAQDSNGDADYEAAERRMTSVSSHAARSEAVELLRSTLRELSDGEREAVVLRGIEQLSNQDAAMHLGERPGTIAMRWSRALEKIRRKIPSSIFEDLAHEEAS